jgi:hypothetical protein
MEAINITAINNAIRRLLGRKNRKGITAAAAKIRKLAARYGITSWYSSKVIMINKGKKSNK